IAAAGSGSEDVAVVVHSAAGVAHPPTEPDVADATPAPNRHPGNTLPLDQQDLLLTPLPAPMVEPILPPTAPDRTPAPSHPALNLPLGGSGDVAPAPPKPAAAVRPPIAGQAAAPPSTVANLVIPPQAGPSTVRTWAGKGNTPPGTPTAFPGSPAPFPKPTPIPVAPAKPEPTPSPVPLVRLRLVVLRGVRIGAEYPLYEGRNTIGRFVDKPVDIELVPHDSME